MNKKFIRTSKAFTRVDSIMAKSLEKYKPGQVFSEEEFINQARQYLNDAVKSGEITQEKANIALDSLKGNVVTDNSYAIKNGYINIHTSPSNLTVLRNENDNVEEVLSNLKEVHKEIADLEEVLKKQKAAFDKTNSELQRKRTLASDLLAKAQTFFDYGDSTAA